MQIIGVDIGTTSICGVALDPVRGDVLNSITINSEAFIESDKTFEKIQSPDKIIKIANEILENLINEDTTAIGVTGQMHGIVYVDDCGKAVSPLYTWQDKRGDEPYLNTTYAKHLGSFAGYGCVTDFYNKQNNLIPKNAASFCTIQDYFVMHLCGLKKPILHSTNAASFGLYDIVNNCFTNGYSPKITTDFAIAGKFKNIPVGVAIGDNQASVFSTLQSENNLLINVGTGSQVSIICDHIINGENLEVRPYFENKYLIVNTKTYNNPLSKLASKLSDGISKTVNIGVEYAFKYISRLIEQ